MITPHTITDDRIFIEKLATFSIKANAASRAVPVFERT
jgi:hypothetical protein